MMSKHLNMNVLCPKFVPFILEKSTSFDIRDVVISQSVSVLGTEAPPRVAGARAVAVEGDGAEGAATGKEKEASEPGAGSPSSSAGMMTFRDCVAKAIDAQRKLKESQYVS